MGRGYARSRCTASAPETLRGILLVMARLILLDSGPLGLIVRAPSKPQVVRCLTWLKAAEFWAFLRQSGIPTASPDALDADVILAGQAALAGQPGDTVTIATTNLAHLSRFPGIDAQTWDQIR